MGDGGPLAAAALGAAAGLALSPLLARWVLSAPDRGNPRWWRPASAPHPSPGLTALTAAAAAAGGALAGAAAGWTAGLPAFVALGLLSAVLAVVDVRTHRLPDRLTGTAAALTAALLLAAVALGPPTLADAGRAGLGAGAALAGLGALRLAAPTGLGFGDVKLGGVLGLALGWLGWSAVFLGLAAGFVLGAVAALALLAVGRAGLRTAVPFGPSLIAGALLVAALSGTR